MRPARLRPTLSRRGFVSFAVAALAGPAMPALAAGRILSGRVSFQERIALPPEALLEVRLIDASHVDSPARSLAVTRVKTRHRMPIPYQLRFDEAKIRSDHSYALQARITVRGKLWFVTTNRHTVFTDRPDETHIKVEFVTSAEAVPRAATGRWLAEAIHNHAVSPALEAIIEIAADGRLTGSSGCNRMTGTATFAGAYMTFDPIISTKMACEPSIMDEESRFLSALAATRLWRIDEMRDKLILVDGHGVTVLRLVRL